MSKKYIDISDLFSRNNLPQTFIKSQSTGNLPEESYTYDPFKSYTYAPFERPTQTPPVTWRQFKSFQTYLFSCLRNRCSTLLNYFIIAIHKNIRSNYAKWIAVFYHSKLSEYRLKFYRQKHIKHKSSNLISRLSIKSYLNPGRFGESLVTELIKVTLVGLSSPFYGAVLPKWPFRICI